MPAVKVIKVKPFCDCHHLIFSKFKVGIRWDVRLYEGIW